MIKFFEEMFNKPTVMWNFWEELVFMVLIFGVSFLVFCVMCVVGEITDKIKKRKLRRSKNER